MHDDRLRLSSSRSPSRRHAPLSDLRYNALLSAQCKARCLYEFRNQHRSVGPVSAPFNSGKSKRLLTNNALTLPWRSIWERCPRLITCSSCLLPCDLDPPLLLSSEQSCQAICSTFDNVECQRSCQFIQNLYDQSAHCSSDECPTSTSCSSSKDCLEKVPQPNHLTAIERKSRRTVKLKWTAERVNNIEPVFYVIEAQWTLPQRDANEQEMSSKWGFVKEEVSNTKAIIRNIQRDHRWYTFRVAAVTRHGHSTFSITTKPFRLSSNASEGSSSVIVHVAPPRNFSIKHSQWHSNTVNVTLGWEEAELPVNGYQISWYGENDRSSALKTIDLSSTTYPLELTIPSLSRHTTYLFKIRSLILPDGDQVQMSEAKAVRFHSSDDQPSLGIREFHLSPPYFINGLIKANISWQKLSSDAGVQQYDLHWIESQCSSDVLSCCYRRDAVTIDNSFQLYDLRFNCTYLLTIEPVLSARRSNHSFQVSFNVSSCQTIEIVGTIRPACPTEKSARVGSSPLNLLVRRNQSGVDLSWQSLPVSPASVVQLRIEQLPNRLELMSVELSPRQTNYFFTYVQPSSSRYLNVTLTLRDGSIVREEQTVFIDDHRSSRNAQFHLLSSSARSARLNSLLLLLLLLFVR